MPATIVDRFRLPYRRLPQACFDDQAFIAVADGPSSDEYEPGALRACPARKFCYGRVASRITAEYYALADPCFAGVLAKIPAAQVLISKDGPYGGPHSAQFWNELPQGRGHDYRWAPADCAHHPVLNCARLGAKQIFLLGYDGYYQTNGAIRGGCYADGLTISGNPSPASAIMPTSRAELANMWITDFNHLAWNISIKANQRLARNVPEIFNLSFGSRHRSVWDVHPETLSQPFGRIDRRGPAMVLHILENSGEIPGVEEGGTVPRAAWGGLPAIDHAEFIRKLRVQEPALALYVRTHASLHALAEMLPEDIQVGGLDVPFDPWLHSAVHHFRLPPVVVS